MVRDEGLSDAHGGRPQAHRAARRPARAEGPRRPRAGSLRRRRRLRPGAVCRARDDVRAEPAGRRRRARARQRRPHAPGRPGDRGAGRKGATPMKALVWYGDSTSATRTRPIRSRPTARSSSTSSSQASAGPTSTATAATRAPRAAARARPRGRGQRRRRALHGLSARCLRDVRALPVGRGQPLRLLAAGRDAPARCLRRAARRAAVDSSFRFRPGSTRAAPCSPSPWPAASARSRRTTWPRARWSCSVPGRSAC